MKYSVNEPNREKHIKCMASEIRAYHKTCGKSEILICNIGTSKIVADSVAPIVGSMLREKKIDFTIIGDLDEQVDGLNVKDVSNNIKKYSDTLIIGIDSCISKDGEKVGTIKLRSIPVKACAGYKKNYTEIGDISIVAITSNNINDLLNSRNYDLKLIYKMAEDISKIIINLDDKLKRSKRRCTQKHLV